MWWVSRSERSSRIGEDQAQGRRRVEGRQDQDYVRRPSALAVQGKCFNTAVNGGLNVGRSFVLVPATFDDIHFT